MKNTWWAMLLAPLLLAGAARAETLQQVLKAPHRQRVYDFAGVLSPSAEAKLRQRIHGMEQRHIAQGAVILVHRVEGASIESFANKVLNRWGVGERGKNNGFVLLAAIDQRKWRLATGTGLEKKIPNAEAAQLMKNAVVPAFRKKQYAAGLDAALVAIQKRASSSTRTAAASSGNSTSTVPAGTPDVSASPTPRSDSGSGLPWLLALIAVPLVIIASLFGNRGRGWNNGYRNQGFWGNNWMSSSNNSSSSSSSSSPSSTSDSSSSSSSSGDYGGGSSSGGGASGSW